MWSSATLSPDAATSGDPHEPPSACTAKSIRVAVLPVSAAWSLHITPILFPPKRITDEMSSLFRPVASWEVAHPPPFESECATYTFFAWVHVAQNVPSAALSKTSVSDETVLMFVGKPLATE